MTHCVSDELYCQVSQPLVTVKHLLHARPLYAACRQSGPAHVWSLIQAVFASLVPANMIMCSIMLCSRIQRCLATPQACMASAGKGKNGSKAALVATTRALAACRNNSSSSICASSRSSTGWPTVAPPFSDHAITLGVPGHLAGTENRCPSPPAAYADQQQLSHYLHEWLEAALLQHANLNTTSTPQAGQTALAVDPQEPAADGAPQAAYTPSATGPTAGAADADWEQVQDAAAVSASALPLIPPHASSTSNPAVSCSSATSSLDDLEVPFAGLLGAAVLLDRSNQEAKASSSSSSSGVDIGPVFDNLGASVVILQDPVVPLPLEGELQHDSNHSSSNSISSNTDEDWSVVSGGSS